MTEYLTKEAILARVFLDRVERKHRSWRLLSFDECKTMLKQIATEKRLRNPDRFPFFGDECASLPYIMKRTKPVSLGWAEFEQRAINNLLGTFDLADLLLHEFSGHLIIAGGCVLTALHRNCTTEQDCDIFFVSDKYEAILFKAIAFIKDQWLVRCPKGSVELVRSDHAITVHLCRKPGDDEVQTYQFVLRAYPSAAHVLGGFDIQPAAVCYDGKRITGTEFGFWSACVGVVVVDTTRRSTTYERRLKKYSERCMVVLPGLDINKFANEIKNLHASWNAFKKDIRRMGYDICTNSRTGRKVAETVLCRQIETGSRFKLRLYKRAPEVLKVECTDTVTKNVPIADVLSRCDPTICASRAVAEFYAKVTVRPLGIKHVVQKLVDMGTILTPFGQVVLESDAGDVFVERRVTAKSSWLLPALKLYPCMDPRAGACVSHLQNARFVPDYNQSDDFKTVRMLCYGRQYHKIVLAKNATADEIAIYLAHALASVDDMVERASCMIENLCDAPELYSHKSYKLLFGADLPEYFVNLGIKTAKSAVIAAASTVLDRIKRDAELWHNKKSTIEWITENPGRQWTASFNPIIEDPSEWYGKYHKKVAIGNVQLETTMRAVLRRRPPFNMLPRDVFNMLLIRSLIADARLCVHGEQ
jgi:hypothetical protein